MGSLKGKVAVVTGGSRGLGKGIAMGLGEAGATVYITGRTVTSKDSPKLMGETLPGTLEETAAEVNRLGGKGIAVGCDHKNDEEVQRLFQRIKDEQGKLDVLVNNAYQWHESMLLGKGFWESPIALWDNQQNIGLRSAYVASVYAAQIMVPNKSGLIVNVSSPCAAGFMLTPAYGVIKAALDRLSGDIAHELRPHNVAALSIWPSAIATEKTQLIASKNPSPYHDGSIKQESPLHVGRAVAALAADPQIMKKSGTIITTADIGLEYGFTEPDGSRPQNVRDLFWAPPSPPIYK